MKITIKINTIDELRKFCDLSNNYPYDVLVQQGRWTVSGKSMMGLMSLVLLDTLDVFVDEIDEESDNFINKVKELKIEA